MPVGLFASCKDANSLTEQTLPLCNKTIQVIKNSWQDYKQEHYLLTVSVEQEGMGTEDSASFEGRQI